jgi:hypothetical protein
VTNISLALIVAAWALIAGSVAVATGAVSEPEGVVVEAPSVLAVEHPKSSATGVIHVRNLGKSAARITLRATDFVSAAGKPLNATVVFSTPGASAPGPVYAATLEPGALHTVKVDAANVWEAGESTAKILDGDREVAVLRAMKYRVPLAVRVVGAGDDPAVLTLEKGRPGKLMLRNEDPMTYHVEWRLTIESESVTDKATLPPNWTTSSPVTVNPRWFSAPLEGFFKDEVKHGTLALRLTPPSTMADPGVPERIIPVRARLVYWPSPLRHPIIMVVVFLALLAGGLCSLMLNQWLPNRLRRVELEERLGDISTRARNLSFGIDSDLRIQVRVERFQLLRSLGSRYAFSPEMAAVLTACAQATDRLQTKVGLLERIDAVGDDVRRLRLVAPPTLLGAVEDLLQKAEDRLRRGQPADADLQAASAIVTDAEAKLSALEQPDADFLKTLIERFQERQKTFDPERPPLNEKLAELRVKHPALFAHLQSEAPGPSLRADAYFDHDLKLLRLDLLHEYLELCGDQSEETEAERAFLRHVGTATAEGYAQARLDLRAIREGIFHGPDRGRDPEQADPHRGAAG